MTLRIRAGIILGHFALSNLVLLSRGHVLVDAADVRTFPPARTMFFAPRRSFPHVRRSLLWALEGRRAHQECVRSRASLLRTHARSREGINRSPARSRELPEPVQGKPDRSRSSCSKALCR